jgi:hypothetical protein
MALNENVILMMELHIYTESVVRHDMMGYSGYRSTCKSNNITLSVLITEKLFKQLDLKIKSILLTI